MGKVQPLALPDRPESVWREAARLVSRISPPAGPIERVVALHVVERAVWEMLRLEVAGGLTDAADAFGQWNRFLVLAEQSPWADLPARLRTLTVENERPSLALRVREFLDSRAAAPLTLRMAARATGTSVRTLTAQFRERYLVSVHEYVIRRRLIAAIRLLLTTDMKVAAIATSVGFSDPTAFYRQSARVLHRTPTSLRNDPHGAVALARTLETQQHPPVLPVESSCGDTTLRRDSLDTLPRRHAHGTHARRR